MQSLSLRCKGLKGLKMKVLGCIEDDEGINLKEVWVRFIHNLRL